MLMSKSFFQMGSFFSLHCKSKVILLKFNRGRFCSNTVPEVPRTKSPTARDDKVNVLDNVAANFFGTDTCSANTGNSFLQKLQHMAVSCFTLLATCRLVTSACVCVCVWERRVVIRVHRPT